MLAMASAFPGTVQTVVMEQMNEQMPTASTPLHRDQRPFQCGYCSVTFDINIRLVHHIREHSFTKPFQCGFCKVSYNTNPELKLHVRMHSLFICLPPEESGVGDIHPAPPTHHSEQRSTNSSSLEAGKSQGTYTAKIKSFPVPASVGGSTLNNKKLLSSRFPTDSDSTMGDCIVDAENTEDTPDLAGDHSVKNEDETRDCPGSMRNGFESDQLAAASSTRGNLPPCGEFRGSSEEARSPTGVILNIGLEMVQTPFNGGEKIKSEVASDEKKAESKRVDITAVKAEQEHGDLNDCSTGQNEINDNAVTASVSSESVCEGSCMQPTGPQSQHCKKSAQKGRDTTSTPRKDFQCNICGACFKASRYVGDHKRRVHKVKSAEDCGNKGDPAIHSPSFQASPESKLTQDSSCTQLYQQASVTTGRSAKCHENVLQEGLHCPDGQIAISETNHQNSSVSGFEILNPTDSSCDKRASGSIVLGVSRLHLCDQSTQGLRAISKQKCFTCSVCGKVLKTKETLRKHKNIVHCDDRPFPCPQCASRFKVKQALLDHISFLHSDERQFQCSHCSARYKTKVQLSIHVRSKHSDERPFQCAQCSARFKQKGHLSEHVLNVHNGERRFPCAQCSLRFKRKIQLTTHVASVHDNQRPFSCPHCAARFKSKGELSNHSNRVHNSDRPHQCADCGKCFKVKADLSQHWCKPRECPVCGRLLSCPSTFASHLRTHSEEKAALCRLCDKAFRTQRQLEIHTRTHTKEKPYTCEFCGQSFTLVNTFTYHRNRHLDARPYGCDICEKRFNSHQGLWQHKRRHLGDKRYACDKCEKMFYNSSSLKRHALTHTDLRPLSCSVCGKTYRCRSTLKYHLKHFHQL